MSDNVTAERAHARALRTAVLLVNLGTPEAPEAGPVRRYLAQFLTDPRIVDIPPLLWRPILHGIILRVRPKRSAAAYRSIWTDQGSPLLVESQALCDGLAKEFAETGLTVRLAMRYGEPSIPKALTALREQGVERLLVVPLYPQYSATTTLSVFDAVADALKGQRWFPELRVLSRYHQYEEYVSAMVEHIRAHRPAREPQRWIFSFHGIPRRHLFQGDPYHCQCHRSAREIAEKLGLHDSQWQVTFQSRFGKEPWLQPYTDETLKQLPKDGIERVAVVCPGFAVDCLETLEEISEENREYFEAAGGKQFDYIPCLNADARHVQMMAAIVRDQTIGWPLAPEDEITIAERKQRAKALIDRATWLD